MFTGTVNILVDSCLLLMVVLLSTEVSFCFFFFFFQAEDGIRDLVRSRGLGDVYKRQTLFGVAFTFFNLREQLVLKRFYASPVNKINILLGCLLYTSDAADERSSVDLGGRRIIKKKKPTE